jgi:hypothetical protein
MRKLSLALCLLLAGGALADTIHLKNGGKFDGQIVSENDKVVVFKIRGLGPQTFKRSAIARIERGSSVFDEYEAKRDAIRKGDADAWFALAKWCMDCGLRQEARKAFRETTLCDPDHAAARRALGFSKIRDKWMTRLQVKRYRAARLKEIEKALGDMKLGPTVSDKESKVAFRPPKGWEKRMRSGGLAVEYEGPGLHGVTLCVGYETDAPDDAALYREAVTDEIRSRCGEIEIVKTGAPASLGGEMAKETVFRYRSGGEVAERHDVFLPREEDLLHVWYVCPAEDFDALRSLFSDVCATFKEPRQRKSRRPFTYKLPDDDWADGFGLPEGMEDTEFGMPEMPPGVAVIHNTVHPVLVWMMRQRAQGASGASLEAVRDTFFGGFREGAAASVTPLTGEEYRREVAGQSALVTPFKGSGGDVSYFEGYFCTFTEGNHLFVVLCFSLEGQMGRQYLEKDFKKLLDSFSI